MKARQRGDARSRAMWALSMRPGASAASPRASRYRAAWASSAATLSVSVGRDDSARTRLSACAAKDGAVRDAASGPYLRAPRRAAAKRRGGGAARARVRVEGQADEGRADVVARRRALEVGQRVRGAEAELRVDPEQALGPGEEPVWESATGLGVPTELQNSVTSKSIRLIFGRIDRSRRVLEARSKSRVNV